jgi:SHS2 domain-containing protein
MFLVASRYLAPVKNYEFIEHTADIGIRVKAKDLRSLFRNSALAMFDIIAGITDYRVRSTERIKISLQGDDEKELFVNWLNELLSLSSAKGLVFCDFQITKLSENNLEAVASGASASGYKIDKEIKAATYHQLKIAQVKGG